jgi:predicted LPLAT superfamily acyltransferase
VNSRSHPAWATRPERGSAFITRAAVWLALALGRSFARLLMPAVSLYFLAASTRDRSASRAFLRRALAREPGIADLFRHFHTFALTVLDRVYLLRGRLAGFDVRIEGEEIVSDLLARGEGCLLVGSHLGSFEIIGAVGRRARVPRVRLVMYRRNAGHLSAAMGAISPELAAQVIALGDPGSMLELEGALAQGDFAGMLADRVLDGEDAVSLPFLGTPARFPRGPFQVAALLKRPVILMVGLYRGGNRYDVHFERLVDMSQSGRAERDAVVGDAMRRYVVRLEHYCRQAPFNWFNFYDFWS